MTPESVLKDYEIALSRQEWSAVEALMHNDVCVTFANGTFKGRSAVKAVFERNFSVIKNEQYSISNVFWVYKSDATAVCLYEFNWKGLIDSKPCTGGGRGTTVLVCENGVWTIITEHLGPFAA